MLSENIVKIAGYVSQLAELEIKSGKADDNMIYAYGWSIGTLFNEVQKLEAEGK